MSAEAFADKILAGMTMRGKVASLLMLHYPGTSVGPIREFVRRYQPGGLILMGDNVPDDSSRLAAMIPKFSSDADLPLLIGIDQEGGIVRRIPTDTAASPQTLRTQAPGLTKKAFAQRGTLLARLGISVNFGIVADATDNLASFIYPRVLGATPAAAAARVVMAVRGERGKVLSTLKHFPGHGATAGDSHSSIPTSSMSLARWKKTAARPFAAGINAGAPLVMFGHLRLSSVDPRPASLSKKWHTILRDDLGFTGISITDDMLMLQNSGDGRYADPTTNAISALKAGNTMLLYVLPADPSTVGIDLIKLVRDVTAAVDRGSIDATSIDSAARAILIQRREIALGR